MTRKIVPVEQIIREAENPTELFIDPDDLITVNPADLDILLDDDEDDEED